MAGKREATKRDGLRRSVGVLPFFGRCKDDFGALADGGIKLLCETQTMLDNLIRNRTTEKDVRAWMDKNGFYGHSATIKELELHAVQRPGWLQVFSFQVRVKSRHPTEAPWQEMFGVVKDDERRRGEMKTQVELFTSAQQQTEKLQQWSEGLIAKSNQQDRSNGNLLLLIAAGIVSATIALSLVNLFT